MLRNPTIGRALKSHRQSKRLTQADIACAKHWSSSLVSMLDQGYIPPRVSTLEEYARLVDLDIEAIRRELRAMLPQLRAAGHQILVDLENIEPGTPVQHVA